MLQEATQDTEYVELNAEARRLSDELLRIKKERKPWAKLVNDIIHIKEADRSFEQQEGFLKGQIQLRVLKSKREALLQEYNQVIARQQSVNQRLKQARKDLRGGISETNAQREYRIRCEVHRLVDEIHTRKDFAATIINALADHKLTEFELKLFGLALDRFELLCEAEYTDRQTPKIEQAQKEIERLQNEVGSLRRQLNQMQHDARQQVTETNLHRDQLRLLIRTLWAERLPATSDEQARRYHYKLLINQEWSQKLEDI